MKVEIDLPPKAIRMIKALNALRGNRGSADIEDHISRIVMRELKKEIAEECGLYGSSEPTMVEKDPYPEKIEAQKSMPQTFVPEDDATGISEGLGDDFDYDEQEDESVLFSSGVKASEVERDMSVENPEVEAAGEAPHSDDQAKADEEAEETFQQMVMGEDVGEDFVDQRVAKRRYRNPKARRAKVEGWNGSNGAELGLGGGITI